MAGMTTACMQLIARGTCLPGFGVARREDPQAGPDLRPTGH